MFPHRLLFAISDTRTVSRGLDNLHFRRLQAKGRWFAQRPTCFMKLSLRSFPSGWKPLSPFLYFLTHSSLNCGEYFIKNAPPPVSRIRGTHQRRGFPSFSLFFRLAAAGAGCLLFLLFHGPVGSNEHFSPPRAIAARWPAFLLPLVMAIKEEGEVDGEKGKGKVIGPMHLSRLPSSFLQGSSSCCRSKRR